MTVGLLSAFLVVLLAWVASRRIHSSVVPTIRGPRGYPFLGNILPSRKVWLALRDYGRDYGPIYSLRILGTPILVLNSASVARALLEAKSGTYASRPLPKMVEMAGMDRGVIFEANPERLREARRLLHLVLQTREIHNIRPILNTQIVKFLHKLLLKPDEFVQHIRNLTAGVTLEISHGYKTQDESDPYVKMANITVQNFAEASVLGGFLVDWIPSCMNFKRRAMAWRNQYTELAERGLRQVEDDIRNGIIKPSLSCKALLDTSHIFDRDVVMYTAAQVYTGGADTSVSTLSSFFLSMVLYPDIMRHAQDEVDRITGGGRMPTYADRPSLPYVDAVMKEIFRCYPPVPAIIRTPIEDDYYRGFFVAKGTVVIVNLWAMLHDETRYPNPETFDPSRWLSHSADSNSDPLEVVFGFGRRACPGRHIAEELLFTTIASIIATFDISPVTDESGNLIRPSGEYTDGGIMSVHAPPDGPPLRLT